MSATARKRDPLYARLEELIVGQPDAIDAIIPFVQMHRADLSPEGRPIGTLLLLGPTGSGKTRTVEALAEILHGSNKRLLKIDCGEFQMEHEVAKLIGAPPGYLGHRETVPVLSKQRLAESTTPECAISLVLFDEIEKAAPSMQRLLLGVLDKATLRLGDNTTVDFENSIIFFTSNLGSRGIQKASRPDYGFEQWATLSDVGASAEKIRKIGLAAVRQKFPAEFVNRIDAVIAYKPLSHHDCKAILEHQIKAFSDRILRDFGVKAFRVDVTAAAKSLLLQLGVSNAYGARELRRTVQKYLVQPIADKISHQEIPPNCIVVLDVKNDDFTIYLRGLS